MFWRRVPQPADTIVTCPGDRQPQSRQRQSPLIEHQSWRSPDCQRLGATGSANRRHDASADRSPGVRIISLPGCIRFGEPRQLGDQLGELG
jgi:hypothetical protein